MRAAVFHELGKPLRVETVDKPQAGPGEIVLKVHYCGICGSDLHSTHPGVFVVPDGTILGHEFAGEIVELGAPGWKVGEMATALPNNACEDCRKLGLGECKDNLGIMCPKNTLTGFHPSAQGAMRSSSSSAPRKRCGFRPRSRVAKALLSNRLQLGSMPSIAAR